uniref:Uncharacterized protein n=1 Tax=Eutreptiella gymnastica TaxID=73025 RepID=A0A7S1IKA0_9EUGL
MLVEPIVHVHLPPFYPSPVLQLSLFKTFAKQNGQTDPSLAAFYPAVGGILWDFNLESHPNNTTGAKQGHKRNKKDKTHGLTNNKITETAPRRKYGLPICTTMRIHIDITLNCWC